MCGASAVYFRVTENLRPIRIMRLAFVTSALALLATSAAAQAPSFESRVDSVFRRWNTNTPGCGVGVAQNGKVLLTKGYGMANLEYGVPLGANSVLESGSVAKQFTSAALALLQLEGKLSLDDDIRKYLPEVPDFGATITIRHLLTHTSGLRDQWGLLTLTGNPPTSQVHTLPLILHIVSRQRELNFPPGAEYLYSNTGYALAAIIVSRVSGQPLAQFSIDRFFRPLGMTKTQWRHDHQAVVRDRATAYERRPNGTYATLMPFTNVYGNGGLLTTMGDLMIWNEALSSGTIPGGKALVDLLETRGTTAGKPIPYALGLSHGTWQGHREIAHSGSTAGYSTYLTRFPDDRVSIAVFCNANDANPTAAARQIAGLLLLTSTTTSPTRASADTVALRAVAGRYRDPVSDNLAEFAVRPEGLQLRTAIAGGFATATGTNTYRAENGATFVFSGAPRERRVVMTDAEGRSWAYEEVVPPAAPSLDLAQYSGSYESPELGVRYEVAVENDQLVVRFPPEAPVRLSPLYRDGFIAGNRTVRFIRDAAGQVTMFRIYAGRVRAVRFDRVTAER